MDYIEIMEEITSGLTGDYRRDFKYLEEQSEKYRAHPMNTEILRGIWRMYPDIVPPEKMKEVGQALRGMDLSISKTIEEAAFQYQKKDPWRALDIIGPLVRHVENADGERMYLDDSLSEYRRFQNILEELLYRFINKPERTVRRIPQELDRLYLMHGSILFELKRFDEAEGALRKALSINPVWSAAMFELGEISKVRKDWAAYLKLMRECHGTIYTAVDLARFYRNMGYHCIEMKDYASATLLYQASSAYEASVMLQSQMYYIQQEVGGALPEYDHAKFLRMCKERDIPPGPSNTVIGVCRSAADEAERLGRHVLAMYFLSVLQDLSRMDPAEADRIEARMARIKKKIKG